MSFTVYTSPIGELTLVGDAGHLRGVRFPGRGSRPAGEDEAAAPLAPAAAQLGEYFRGERMRFDLEVGLQGSEFALHVWEALREIPYGETRSYGEVARAVGASGPEAARDTAQVIARTPTPIVIPCHRVIGADGSLTGYGGGLRRKRALLDFEASGGERRALDAAWVQRQLELI